MVLRDDHVVQRVKLQLMLVMSAMVLSSPFLAGFANVQSVYASTDQMPARARLGVPFQLAVNETVHVAGSSLSVTFFNVTEDSRCPADAVCIWAGQVTVMVGVRENSTDLGRFNLTLGDNASAALQNVSSYSIRLTEVQPYPLASQPTSPSDYIATLVVSGDSGGKPVMARSVLVKAVGNVTGGAGIKGLISAWSVDREFGVAVLLMRNDDMSLWRGVAKFMPSESECTNAEMGQCIDGVISSVSAGSGISEGDPIHLEISSDKSTIYLTVGSDEYQLDISKHKEVSKPYVPRGNSAMATP
jgi:hypothetical protein